MHFLSNAGSGTYSRLYNETAFETHSPLLIGRAPDEWQQPAILKDPPASGHEKEVFIPGFLEVLEVHLLSHQRLGNLCS